MGVAMDISDIVGQKFGRLTVTEFLGSVNRKRKVEAICECGKIKDYRLLHLIMGITSSCGCLRDENTKKANTTHGLYKHPLHTVWVSMKLRCYYEDDISYHNYGAIGVFVCDEWLKSFKSFYDWAIENGYKKGLQLDKDKFAPNQIGKCYSPEFCSFITAKENNRLKKNGHFIEYNNEVKQLVEWCEILELTYKTISDRLRRGWGIKKSLETPIAKKYGKKIINYNTTLT